jgi:uncharacterized DUF497 family protein
MIFEFDKTKSESNVQKHGIDFNSAQALWDDPDRIIIPARCTDEDRFMLIGMISSTCWSAVFAERNEKIRIISVRRSRQDEKELYRSS